MQEINKSANQHTIILSLINQLRQNEDNYQQFLEIKNQLLPYITFDENQENVKIKPFDKS